MINATPHEYSYKLPSNKKKSRRSEQSSMKKRQQQKIRSNITATSKFHGIQKQQQYMKKEDGRESLRSNQSVVRGKRINEIKADNLFAAPASSSNSIKPPPGLRNFPRDIDNAIRRIESGILDLHHDHHMDSKPMIQLAATAHGQISKRLVGSRQGQAHTQARAQAQAHCQISKRFASQIDVGGKRNGCAVHGLRSPHSMHQKEIIMRKNNRKPPTRQAILRPTLIEVDCSSCSESDGDVTSISMISSTSSSSWKTNTSETESEMKSYRSIKNSSDNSSSCSTSTDYGVQTNKHTRLYQNHKATKNTALERLKNRFKNKLGFIFHHHHHHHHHHHDHRDSKVHHATWKHLQDNIQHNNKQQLAKAEAKTNHFGKLVQGLKHNYKKKSKGGRKNLHWWEMFKRNGGLKLGNRRANVRLGLNKPTYKQLTMKK